jgi:hypothetical protein
MNSLKKKLPFPFSDKSSRNDSQATTESTNAGSIASASAERPSFEWLYETEEIPGLSFDEEKSYSSGLEGSSQSHGTRSLSPTIPEKKTQWNEWDGTLLPRSPPRLGHAKPKRRDLGAVNSSPEAPKDKKRLLDGNPARTKSS